MDALRLLALLNLAIIVVLGLNPNDPHVCSMRDPRTKRLRPACCEGFFFNRTTHSCQPKCKDGCLRGHCVTTNLCTCKPPLILHNNNECIDPPPKCDRPCKNANCTATNTCTCHDGYEHSGLSKDIFECEPVCRSCENGKCVAPETCECNTNYQKINDKCEPICKRPCENGICAAPDNCTCNVGYEKDPLDIYICRRICETPCVNGSCVSGVCNCYPGYTAVNSTACAPICTNCTHGDCIAPETCKCHQGYSLDAGECRPICKRGCVNGSCVAPDQCECLDGYRKSKDSAVCERDDPICGNCDNGRCVSRNVCFCNEGYVMVDGRCKPTCSKPCVNGECVEPNKCECLDGFTRNETDVTSCYKNCSCDNGVCKDGECVCNRGFDLVNDTCTIIKPIDCSSCNSSCPDELCWCSDGIPCHKVEDSAEESSAVRLAGLEMGWLLGGCVGILLVTAMIIVIGHIWRKNRYNGTETLANGDHGNSPWNGSILFTAPETLKKRGIHDIHTNIEEHDENTEIDPLAPAVVSDHRI